jgi:D-lactate dehydrogenase (cytochrome)
VGDGNFHQAVMYKSDDETQRQAVSACVHKMMNMALEMEGTVSVNILQEPVEQTQADSS